MAISTEQKRVFTLVGAFTLVAALVAAAVIWLMPDDSSREVKETYTVTTEDSTELSSSAIGFVEVAGDMGIRSSEISGNNMLDVSRLVATNGHGADTYFVSRLDAYKASLKYIASGGDVDYDDRAVASWSSETERGNLLTITPSSIVTTVAKTGSYVNVNGARTPAVTVDVTFDSSVVARTTSANDTDWDGSYLQTQKDFYGESVSLQFVEVDGAWKVWQVLEQPAHKWTLATWKNPASDFTSDVLGGSEIEPLKRTDPMPELPETQDPANEGNANDE